MGLLSGQFTKEWGGVHVGDEFCHWGGGVYGCYRCKTRGCQILQLCGYEFLFRLVLPDCTYVVVGVSRKGGDDGVAQ